MDTEPEILVPREPPDKSLNKPPDPSNNEIPINIPNFQNINNKVNLKDARKIRVHSKDNSKALGALHPRQIKKFLLETIGKSKELKVQSNVDILIITTNEDQTKKLVELNSFCNIPVEVSAPSGRNCCQGVITKNKENSNTVLLTFDNKMLPTHIYIGFERFPVSQYVMKPLRCFNCQALC